MLVLDTVFWEEIQFGLLFRNVLNTTYKYSYKFRNNVSKSNTVFVLLLETVFWEVMPWATVRAYRETFAGEPMPSTLAVCMKTGFTRARQVAAQGYVSVPRACASATLVCAYASLQCENLFRRQCWFRSSITKANRKFRDAYPTVDLQFWVICGSC